MMSAPKAKANQLEYLLGRRILRYGPALCGWLAVIFGIIVLCGWQFRIPVLRFEAAGTFVSPNAAACFILSGIALLLSCGPRLLQFLSIALALVVFAFSALVLIEYATGIDFAIDSILMKNRLDSWNLSLPRGRFAWPTAISFCFVSAAISLQMLNSSWARLREALVCLAFMFSFLSLLGRLYSAVELYAHWMAPATAFTFLILCFGVMSGPAKGPLTEAFSSGGPGGILARRFLLVTFVVIPLLGWVRLFFHWYEIRDLEFGTALFVVSVIVVLVPLIFSTAFTLDRLEENRKSTTDALLRAEKLATTGRFAAQMAHEINNPLEAVTNLVYLANTSSGAKAIDYLTLAEQELARIAHITKQTLGFYRDAAEAIAVAVAPLVFDIRQLLESKWRPREIRVEQNISEHQSAFANPGELRQVLSNLILNAIDASRPGGLVNVTAETSGDYTLVHVSDQGPGIPSDLLPRIFEPFFTTKKNGTGLGLWVTKELVTKNKGTLAVQSSTTSPQGTTFTLRIPQTPRVEEQGDKKISQIA
jgi:signal transduction histidine kinase